MDHPPTRRGRLRVYLGAAPGVGKTYKMLDEGQRRAARGTDVVVGYVDTHGRVHTAEQLDGLEVVPRQRLAYGGSTYEEMDLAAVLARRPEVALVDELAHTNVAGAGHVKRWEDVEALLDAGIDVVTTVNVQHLESLNDVVESITGIRQRETVPDQVVRSADAVELVDMSPQALRRRLAHGNVYAADKVDAALSRYFREGNLSALRELALLWVADQVDEGLARYRQQHRIDATWPTRERIVVAVTGGPESPTLLRRAALIAGRTTRGEWMAVYVTRRDGLSGTSPDQLARQHAMVHDMGGSFHTVVADDVAGGLLEFARAENASQILIGASRRPRWSAAFRPGVGERVIAGSGDIDVHIVSHDEARRGARDRDRRPDLGRGRTILGYVLGLVAPALTALLLYTTNDLHDLTLESMLMLSVVVVVALVGGLVPAMLAAVLSAILLNWFFVAPVHTLTIAQGQYVAVIAVFVVVGVAVASVVDLAAGRAAQARRASAEADALSVLSHSLLRAGESLPALLAQATEVFGMRGAAILTRTGDGWATTVAHGDAPESVADADVDVPIDESTFLVLRGRTLDASDRRLVTAYAAHAGVVIERTHAAEEHARAHELAEADRTRTALLAAVSHDLRSPLAAIKAAVTSLRNDDITWSEQDEADLLMTIEESADRLDALVANLLDMSRLRTGALTVLATDVDVVELARIAVAPLADADRVEVRGEQGVPPAYADPGLLERVLANLCENALKHTTSRVLVQVSGYVESDGAPRTCIRVVDHGPGVDDSDLDRLFAPFQRLGDVPQGDGVGLGLAVARGLTEAMSGRLEAEETPGGGLTFVLTLPQAVVRSPATPEEETR
ncbi:ATP-binding protein [Mumia sp. ZJ430]|uniref:sensor histidine kinase n=1 Tax=Mumia sp. ZJ430 TaxID=2708083 RepID=UPI001FBABD8F|nr:ATP-binding protein [Mumia sp. ZJ430]